MSSWRLFAAKHSDFHYMSACIRKYTYTCNCNCILKRSSLYSTATRRSFDLSNSMAKCRTKNEHVSKSNVLSHCTRSRFEKLSRNVPRNIRKCSAQVLVCGQYAHILMTVVIFVNHKRKFSFFFVLSLSLPILAVSVDVKLLWASGPLR